jgi:DNA-binding HxlR family transcriptional regulator
MARSTAIDERTTGVNGGLTVCRYEVLKSNCLGRYPRVVKHADLRDENCAIARSAAIVGERWVWVILRQAFNGARRFEDFQRGIGLARNVLTDRLNWLVDHGILQRQRYAEHTARDLNEYRLTAKGRALFPVYVALMNWGNQWTGLPAPPVDLLHKPCGHRVGVRVVCSECGQDIDARDTEPVVGRGLIMHRRGTRAAN